MKSSTLIISAILLAATFLPLIYLITQTSRKESKVRKAIQKLCELNKITLSEMEINGDLILGIDQTSKKLICSNRKLLSEKFEIIDLNLQSDCKIKTLRNHGKHLEWVGLELSNTTSKKEIVFYQEDEDDAPIVDPHKCLKEAEKWQNIIKPLLKAS
ncbi:hypothetical protein KXJ69_03635 [Aureisphaera sp. CAU 1614]|uniref:Uncharacterized protein n=1 Tax=Halomarinibacterium sedimenti TaxID=2857106 RepID=A0A9X1FM88_9FLAO|nr:hypothetical protein [Halomarinibacterium sedimenti]MBW2937181.1 hypothetical protein [Halomarinibacterium sedimenti]